MDKKIILSVLLVLCIAFSVSAVTAADSDDDVVAETDDIADDVVAETNDDVSSVSDDSPVISTEKKEETGTFAGLNETISNIKDGDEIELKENCAYDVNGTKWTIGASNVVIKGKNTTINVNGTAQGGEGATFILDGTNITLYGIIFNNINGKVPYGGTISGYAVTINSNSDKAKVDNCSFLNFNSGAYVSGSNVKIVNSYFNGSSTKVTNAGKGEKGTKAINAMGAKGLLVENNTFEGQVLDAVSFASGGSGLVVRNNTFKDNVYAIFFGGAATKGTIIENNKFINCGYCPEANMYDLPVISAQKSATGYKIVNNEFVAGNDSYLIKTESGNTAHGYPSSIGNITISGNNVTVADGVDASSVTFVHILSNKGPLNPTDSIKITDNNIALGINHVTVWYNDWGNENGDVIIPKAELIDTALLISNISTVDKKITIFLKEADNSGVANAIISYKINGGDAVNETTDDEGYLTISNLNDNCTIEISFAGDDAYKGSSASMEFTAVIVNDTAIKELKEANEKLTTEKDDANKALAAKDKEATQLTVDKTNLQNQLNTANSQLASAKNANTEASAKINKVNAASKVKKSKNFQITVTLSSKKVNGKYVYVIFNGKSYKAKVKNGVAKITIKKSALKKLSGKTVKYQVVYDQSIKNKSVKVKK